MNAASSSFRSASGDTYLDGQQGLGAWFSAVDHKKIAMMFLGWTLGSFLLGAIFLLVYIIGQTLLDPFEGRPTDTPMSSIIRTIEINLLEQIGETDIPAPVEPVDGSYLL